MTVNFKAVFSPSLCVFTNKFLRFLNLNVRKCNLLYYVADGQKYSCVISVKNQEMHRNRKKKRPSNFYRLNSRQYRPIYKNDTKPWILLWGSVLFKLPRDFVLLLVWLQSTPIQHLRVLTLKQSDYLATPPPVTKFPHSNPHRS